MPAPNAWYPLHVVTTKLRNVSSFLSKTVAIQQAKVSRGCCRSIVFGPVHMVPRRTRLVC